MVCRATKSQQQVQSNNLGAAIRTRQIRAIISNLCNDVERLGAQSSVGSQQQVLKDVGYATHGRHAHTRAATKELVCGCVGHKCAVLFVSHGCVCDGSGR